MTHDGTRWYVISTKARREEFAQDQLGRRGVTTFLPRILEPVRGMPRPRIAPLFPGYLFVHIAIEEQFFHVVWTPGVRRFVGFGDVPSPIEDAVVEFLQLRTGVEGVLRRVPVYHSGDRVRITSGSLKGLVGIIEHPGCGRGRVRVLMELLRRQTRVEVPQEVIERLSA